MQQIGRYKVVRELGRGAIGVVLEARDPLIGRTVAIKTVNLEAVTDPQERKELQDRLLREARAAGILSHPAIVTIHDVGAHQGLFYIAMERVDGQTLQQLLIGGRPMVRAEALDILRQTAVALDYAHAQGVVHRDIKPGNIMLHRGSLVKVTDFGIAKLATTHYRTRTGLVQGTPSYMAPEQINAEDIDGRTDQFSLAVTAYEKLTGRKPFRGETLGALIQQILSREPPLVGQRTPVIGHTDTILRKALAKARADRYNTCVEFVDALEAAPIETGADEDLTRREVFPVPSASADNSQWGEHSEPLTSLTTETLAQPGPEGLLCW